MDFYDVLKEDDIGLAYNPFAAKLNGEWVGGYTSIDFLNKHFGHLKTVEDMINATKSEGLQMFFTWLKDKGILN